jgi:hypothetical protein
MVLAKCASPEFEVNAASLIDESLRRLKTKKLEQKRRALLTKMQSVKNDRAALDDLLIEKKYLDGILSGTAGMEE